MSQKKGTHAAQSAIVIVDMQSGFLNPVAYASVVEMIKKQQATIRKAAKLGIPIFGLELEAEENGTTIPQIAKLIKKYGVMISKSGACGICDSDLYTQLKARGVTRVLIMGVQACRCVQATLLCCMRRGLDVVVAEDTIACLPDCIGFMNWYRKHGLVVTGLEAFLDKLVFIAFSVADCHKPQD